MIVFSDAEELVVRHVADTLAERGQDVHVGTHVPHPRPTPFVLARRLGGPRRDMVTDLPEIGFECWAATAVEAHDLAQLCRAISFGMRGRAIGGVAVYRVDEIGGPAQLPDPISDEPRYVFTHQIAMRGRAA
jgi:hypothetical protein